LEGKGWCYGSGSPAISMLTHRQSKLKSLHEVVVRNRLEQLRKRQRDEALQAQVELLGNAATELTRQWPAEVRPLPSRQEEEDAMDVDESEPYARGMSPPLFEPGRLSYDDRQLQTVDPLEELKTLVRTRRFGYSSDAKSSADGTKSLRRCHTICSKGSR
jgi:hypothetical protein